MQCKKYGWEREKRIGRLPKYYEMKRQQKKLNKPGWPKRKQKGVVSSLLDVKSVIISSFNDWSDQSEDNETCFVKPDHGSVTHSIIFTPDLHWKLYIHLFANIVYYVI